MRNGCGSDTIVEFDHGIDTVIRKLRQALGVDATNPRYIETLSRRGYRSIEEVNWIEAACDSGPSEKSCHPRQFVNH
jgi:DNA-binding winged helix-turn-helix (wHTH) protein